MKRTIEPPASLDPPPLERGEGYRSGIAAYARRAFDLGSQPTFESWRSSSSAMTDPATITGYDTFTSGIEAVGPTGAFSRQPCRAGQGAGLVLRRRWRASTRSVRSPSAREANHCECGCRSLRPSLKDVRRHLLRDRLVWLSSGHTSRVLR
jgi:hypothetical protein